MKKPLILIVFAVVIVAAIVVKIKFITPTISADYKLPSRVGPTSDQLLSNQLAELERNPNDPATLASAAEMYFSRANRSSSVSDYQKARELAKLSLKVLPKDNYAAELVLAKLLAEQHDFIEAIEAAEKIAAKSAKVRLQALPLLITSYLGVGNSKRASELADELVQTRPTSLAMSLRALVLEEQGRDQESFFEFKRALELEDIGDSEQSAWIRAVFARHCLKHHDLKNAAILLENALKISPELPLALDISGELSLVNKNFDEADRFFNQAFRATRDSHLLIQLANSKNLQNKPEAAKQYFSQAESLVAADIEKGSFGHRLDLAIAIIGQGSDRSQKAIDLALEELKRRQNSKAWYVLARAYSSAKKWDQALAAVLAALRSGTREPKYYAEASAIYKELGNQQRAEFYERLAREIN